MNSASVPEREKRALETKLRKKMGDTFEICFAGRIDKIITFVPFCDPKQPPPKERILDDETRVLMAMETSKCLSWFSDKKRNKHDDIAVEFRDAKDRREFLDILRNNYLPEEGVRCIHRLLKSFLKSRVIKLWHLDKLDCAKMRCAVSVHATESEVDIDVVDKEATRRPMPSYSLAAAKDVDQVDVKTLNAALNTTHAGG